MKEVFPYGVKTFSGPRKKKLSSELDLSIQKHDFAFRMFLHEIKREEFSPVVLCEISSEKSIWHPSRCELLD